MTSRRRAVQLADRSDGPFRRLYAAQRLITSDLDLSTMLTRVVESTCEVIGVSGAVLAAVSPTGTVDTLLHRGLDNSTAALLDRASTAEQVSTLMRTAAHFVDAAAPRPDRTRPRPAGTIEYARVAITTGDEHYADLYAVGPVDGSFTDTARELIDALSRIAGTAIAHARSFDRERRSTEWLYASGEVARALLAGADVDMLNEIVARAVSASGADYGQLVIPTTDGRIQIIATSGLGAADLRDTVHDPAKSPLGRIVVEGRVLRVPDIDVLLSDTFNNRHSYGPSMVAPLTDALGIRGSIMVTRTSGSRPFAAYELDLFATYASQVALAMQFSDARLDAERLQLLDTRHQTARELHDIVMQRLFATGVGLDTLVGQLDDDQAAQLRRYVTELDDTINEIRERVFGTRGDAQAVSPTISRFPRVAHDTVPDATGTATGAASPVVRPVVRPAASPPRLRRGRRRSDWEDGTGRQRR